MRAWAQTPAPPPPPAAPVAPAYGQPGAPYTPAPAAVPGTGAKCISHAECTGNQLCINYRCSDPPGGPPPVAVPPPPPPTPGGGAGVPAVRASTGEAVTFTLAPPPKFTVNFEMGGFANYASGYDFSFAGGGLELGGHGIIGITDFPDTHGGSWQGVALQAFFRPSGGGFWGHSTGGGFATVFGGVGAGYTYMSIRDIDLDYNQRGIGFMATYRLGAANSWYFGDSSSLLGGLSHGSFSHGPWVALILPQYAAHRGHLSYGFFNVDIVFTQVLDNAGLTVFELGGGGAF